MYRYFTFPEIERTAGYVRTLNVFFILSVSECSISAFLLKKAIVVTVLLKKILLIVK